MLLLLLLVCPAQSWQGVSWHQRQCSKREAYRFTRDDLSERAALQDGRVLGAAFRNSKPELGLPKRISVFEWLRSGLWLETTAFLTALRVLVPSVLTAIVASVLFRPACLYVSSFLGGGDSSVFFSQVAPLIGLIFSVFTNFTFSLLYSQQETALVYLFQEISCAKSLVEQILLVFGSEQHDRKSPCYRALVCVQRYASRDLRKRSSKSAEQLKLSVANEACYLDTGSYDFNDPLEELLYLSSNDGNPSSHVYATVKELRKLRANRLGALERKLPPAHFVLLYGLGFLLLGAFLLDVSAGIAINGASSLQLELSVFAVATFALTASLRVLQDIWSPKTGAYNVDAVLVTCVTGLERQLDELLRGGSTNKFVL